MIDEEWRRPGYYFLREKYAAEDTLNIELNSFCSAEDYLQGANEVIPSITKVPLISIRSEVDRDLLSYTQVLEQLIESPKQTLSDLIRSYMLGRRLRILLEKFCRNIPIFKQSTEI